MKLYTLFFLILFKSNILFALGLSSIFISLSESTLKKNKFDGIKDLEIEGIAINSSLLDHLSKNEIQNNIIELYQHLKDDSFTTVVLTETKKQMVYDEMQVIIKRNDRKFRIYGISGGYFYKENIEDCYLEMDKIEKDISYLFKNVDKIGPVTREHPADPSKKSTYTGTYYSLPKYDSIWVECYDWDSKISKKNGWIDNLRITISTKQFSDWLNQ